MKDPVQVYYKFKNEEKASLGMPLPAGNVRVYQKPIRKAACSSPAKTASITRPRMKPSACTSATLSTSWPNASRPISSASTITLYEMEYEITLRNHKDAPITVEVNEPIGGDWEMLISTYKCDQDGRLRRAVSVPVDKDGTSVLKYRVRARW